jgi:hypothetical protein
MRLGPRCLVVFARNEHSVDVDEPPAGFSQGDENTTSAPEWNAAGQRVGHLDAAGSATALFQRSARLQFTFTSTLQRGQITATGCSSAAIRSRGSMLQSPVGPASIAALRARLTWGCSTGNSSWLTYELVS